MKTRIYSRLESPALLWLIYCLEFFTDLAVPFIDQISSFCEMKVCLDGNAAATIEFIRNALLHNWLCYDKQAVYNYLFNNTQTSVQLARDYVKFDFWHDIRIRNIWTFLNGSGGLILFHHTFKLRLGLLGLLLGGKIDDCKI